MSSQPSRDGRKLALCACEELLDGHEAKSTSKWVTVACTSIDEIVKLAQADALDAVALRFDTMDENAREMFLQLKRVQKNQKPVLVSYSTFNPDWIENLVFGSGANIHIRGDLRLDEVARALDEHLQNELSVST